MNSYLILKDKFGRNIRLKNWQLLKSELRYRIADETMRAFLRDSMNANSVIYFECYNAKAKTYDTGMANFYSDEEVPEVEGIIKMNVINNNHENVTFTQELLMSIADSLRAIACSMPIEEESYPV